MAKRKDATGICNTQATACLVSTNPSSEPNSYSVRKTETWKLRKRPGHLGACGLLLGSHWPDQTWHPTSLKILLFSLNIIQDVLFLNYYSLKFHRCVQCVLAISTPTPFLQLLLDTLIYFSSRLTSFFPP